MPLRLSCVVEGHGEVESVPILVRRIAASLDNPPDVIVQHPIRIPKSKLVKPGELERAVELAARIGAEGILVLLDSDDDCPAILGPAILQRARSVRGDLPIGVVVAKREFEAWFLAAADSLRGRCGLPEDLDHPPDPESIRGAKEWLTRQMPGSGYSPTVDQPALTAHLNLALARRVDSFEKCYREIVRLLSDAGCVATPATGPAIHPRIINRTYGSTKREKI